MAFAGTKEEKGGKNMKYVAVVFICLTAFILGCGQPYTVGKAVNQEKISQIDLGKSNADQVVSVLGKPDEVERGIPGEEKYIYRYYQDRPTHWWRINEVQEQRLEVTLKEGIAQRVNLVEQDTGKAQ
jgi:outer membrane protein assembly factor BamE (lipoprotein component of BamABCDE complex)